MYNISNNRIYCVSSVFQCVKDYNKKWFIFALDFSFCLKWPLQLSLPWPISISYTYVCWAGSQCSESLHLWVPTNPCHCLILLMKALLWDRSGCKFSIPIKMCKLNRGSWLSTLALTHNAFVNILRQPIHFEGEEAFSMCLYVHEYPGCESYFDFDHI